MRKATDDSAAGKGGPWVRMLAARPMRNTAAEEAPAEGGGISISVKRVRPWYMVPPLSWIVPVRKHRIVQLDRLGAVVWQLCDGRHTVESIVDKFAVSYRLTFHESRAAVTNYLKLMIQRGLLAIAMPAET